jgi:hypothetical protein
MNNSIVDGNISYNNPGRKRKTANSRNKSGVFGNTQMIKTRDESERKKLLDLTNIDNYRREPSSREVTSRKAYQAYKSHGVGPQIHPMNNGGNATVRETLLAKAMHSRYKSIEATEKQMRKDIGLKYSPTTSMRDRTLESHRNQVERSSSYIRSKDKLKLSSGEGSRTSSKVINGQGTLRQPR